MQIGFIGLGRMGNNMVLHLLENGADVVVWNRTLGKTDEAEAAGARVAKDIDDLVAKLEPPRAVWVMVSAGSPVDAVLESLRGKLSKGDLIIDGGNSHYHDTLRRKKELAEHGIHFMDIGTSGGVESARSGACLMAGGDAEDFERVQDILSAMAAPGGFGLLGPTGAGHFAKMVHNGIEYGMMESIAEGAALLKHSEFAYNMREVFRVFSVRSIIESRLVSWTLDELNKDPELASISSTIGSAGTDKRLKAEGDWTLEFAKKNGIKIPAIEASMKVRDNSADDPEDSPEGYRNKIVSAMRGQFGHHPVSKKK